MEPALVTDRVLVKIVVCAAVAVAGLNVGFVDERPAPKYIMVDQLGASGLRAHENKHLAVHGFVVPGSIRELGAESEARSFLLEHDGVALRVVHGGVLPDLFRDHTETVVTGQLVNRDGGWVLDATQISTKCFGKYEGGSRSVPDVVKFK